MNDLELENRIRTALNAVADATPTEPVPVQRASARRWLGAAACLALLVGAVGVAVRHAADERRSAVSSTGGPSGDAHPAGFDERTAAPIFATAGTPQEVVTAYLRARFPDFPNPGLEVGSPRITDDVAVARWSTSDTGGTIAEGTVLLRTVGAHWAVIAATTAEVDLQDISYDGKRVDGTMRTSDDNLLAADVLDPNGDAIGGAGPGRTGSDYTFGTAGEGHGAVTLDVPAEGHPVHVMARLVGGTILSITEYRLDPPADTTTQLAAAEAQQPAWELVATDEASGHWVTLRAPGMTGTFRLRADGPVTTPFLQLGPCCEIQEHILVVAALHREATGMRIILSDGTAVAAPAVEDPGRGVTYAVTVIPRTAIPTDTTARAEIRIGDEFVDSDLQFDLATIGG